MPALRQLAQKVDPSQVAIISINEGDPQDLWLAFLAKNDMNWTQIYDKGGILKEAFAVHSFPHYLILDREGIILSRFDGWGSEREAELRSAIQKGLKK